MIKKISVKKNINNKISLIKSGNLGKNLGKIVQKKKTETSYQANISRISLIFIIKQLIKTALNRGIKIFLIKMAEVDYKGDFSDLDSFAGIFHPLLLNEIGNLELVDFGLVGTRIKLITTNEKPISRISMAIVGIRSVIGYNPYLSNMIHEQMYQQSQILEIQEIKGTKESDQFVDMLESYSKKIKFIDFSGAADNLYLLDQIEQEILIYENIEFSAPKITKEMVLLNKKNGPFFLANTDFNKQTVLMAIYYYKLFEKRKKITKDNVNSFLKKSFPKQLKYLNLEVILDFFFDDVISNNNNI